MAEKFEQYRSLAKMAAECRTDVESIRSVVEDLQVRPSFTQNGVAYFNTAAFEAVRDRAPAGMETRSHRGRRGAR